MDGRQRHFLHALSQFDNFLARRNVKKADRVLEDLRQMSTRSQDPAVKAQMQAIVAAQAARLRDLRQQRARESIAATAKRKTAKPNAVCELCGQPYRRGKKESRRRFCFICRPSTPASTSVRTIGGGLPTLGKGHW